MDHEPNEFLVTYNRTVGYARDRGEQQRTVPTLDEAVRFENVVSIIPRYLEVGEPMTHQEALAEWKRQKEEALEQQAEA